MASIGLRFINSADFVGRGIDWVTHSLMDHAEFWFDAEAMAMVIEILKRNNMPADYPAEGGYLGAHAGSGVELRGLDYCVPTWERRYALPCTDAQFEKFVVSAFGKVGMGYNYLGIIGILVRARKMTSNSREFCSEYCYDEFWKIGIEMLNALDEDSDLITPEMLHLSNLLIGRCTYRFPGVNE